MSRRRSLAATSLTILVAASLGSLPASGAAVRSHARFALKSHTRAHAKRTLHPRLHPTHQAARPRTRGFRGVHRGGGSTVARPTAAAGRPAAIAAVLATTCQNTELVPTPANLEAVRAAVLCLINRQRALNGEGPLALNQQLVQAAEGHSREMVADNYFQHVSPSGLSPVDRIRAAGYLPNPSAGYVIGENLAWGTLSLATPQAIVNAWLASPGHLANILETQYAETGIGVMAQVPASLSGGAEGATYTQEFGVIVH
jgi:uncharacterized protein YkwD